MTVGQRSTLKALDEFDEKLPYSHSLNQETDHESSNGGTFLRRYSTISSGWRLGWMACVLIPGVSDRAVAWICSACSGVHIGAQNCDSVRRNEASQTEEHLREDLADAL